MIAETLHQLGLAVIERGWLSSNNVVFATSPGSPATVVDTGYDTHSDHTLALIDASLCGRPPERVLNTHLHADHCGGNHAMQKAWDCAIWVPASLIDAVRTWDQDRLTYRATGQRCRRFTAHHALEVGSTVQLGPYCWEVLAAPGHDPESVMFFQHDSRVLISADALWQERLAIVFPELAGVADGFAAAESALDAIEALAPRIVIPGHGAVFSGVDVAISNSRQRLACFSAEPRRHRDYAERALTVFRMLETRRQRRTALVAWLRSAPVFARDPVTADQANRLIDRLVAQRQLFAAGADILVCE